MHEFDFTQHRTWEICYENSNNAKIPRGITQPFLYSYVKYVKQIVEFAKILKQLSSFNLLQP